MQKPLRLSRDADGRTDGRTDRQTAFQLYIVDFAWADQRVQVFYNYHIGSSYRTVLGSYRMLE